MKINKFSLFQYIVDRNALFEDLNYELKGILYHYGENFKRNNEKIKKTNIYFKYLLEYIYFIFNKKNKNISNKKILSSAYYTFDKNIEQLNYKVFRSPWSLKRPYLVAGTQAVFFKTKQIQNALNFQDFKYLTSDQFAVIIQEYYISWKEYIKENSFDALVVPNDVGFFERLTIKIFKELGKPTINFAHGGMPSLYDGKFENRTDYVIMWGKKQVDAYVEMGYNKNKFFVSGHPFYTIKPKQLSFALNDILVLNKNVNGACPLEENHLEDRGNAILYLLTIQNVLLKFGIKSVRLRLHPSQNEKWYRKYLDTNFFIFDKESLDRSIKKSTLLIGPTSTTILDAMANGVNYLIYEPAIDGKTIMGYPVTPPLDGKDKRVPIARNEENLYDFLKEKKGIDVTAFDDYVKLPFDISFLKDII